MNSPIAAIILAAGASRRLGQPKQLLVHEGETLLKRAIRLSSEAGAKPIMAVLGAHFELIAPSIESADAVTIFNERWEDGIATSIHAGLNALHVTAPGVPGVLTLSCDQPRVTAEHLRGLVEAFAAQPVPSIVASAYAGIVGIPAVFPQVAFPQLLELRGDKGARALLLHPPCPLITRPFAGGEIDIDLPDDLQQLS